MSGIRSLVRSAAVKGPASAASAPIYISSTDNKARVIPAGTGTTEVELLAAYAPVTNSGANLSLTASLHGNKTVVHNEATGRTYTLPAASGSGNKYRVVVGVSLTGGSLVVNVASGSDYMRGVALFETDDAANVPQTFPTANTGTLATESDTITFNRTTSGLGTIGDYIEAEDILSGVWAIKVVCAASGSEVTPFSAAV